MKVALRATPIVLMLIALKDKDVMIPTTGKPKTKPMPLEQSIPTDCLQWVYMNVVSIAKYFTHG